MTQYELSKNFWDFAFENPEKIKPTHIAIYFFAMEHCNRLGWKEKFGIPTTMTMEAIGINSYHSYKKHFTELADWGVIKIIELSKNQYSSNVICLQFALSKNDKALVKATTKHTTKQLESKDSIDKLITNNKETNNGLSPKKEFAPTEKQLLDFEGFLEWIERHTPDVLTMRKPFTIEQYITLRGEMPYARRKNKDGTPVLQPGVPKEVVQGTLIDLQNKTSYRKTFESPFYCITRWHEKNKYKK